MNNNCAVDLKNPVELRKKGLEALEAALGPIGMTYFLRQYDVGSGNYTEERHKYLDDITITDFEKMLADHRNGELRQ